MMAYFFFLWAAHLSLPDLSQVAELCPFTQKIDGGSYRYNLDDQGNVVTLLFNSDLAGVSPVFEGDLDLMQAQFLVQYDQWARITSLVEKSYFIKDSGEKIFRHNTLFFNYVAGSDLISEIYDHKNSCHLYYDENGNFDFRKSDFQHYDEFIRSLQLFNFLKGSILRK